MLGDDFDEVALPRARLREDDQTRGIGDALLDQRNLAGIGNLWKSEGASWRPSTPGARSPTLADAEALAIVRETPA